jgi:hypothetical protein
MAIRKYVEKMEKIIDFFCDDCGRIVVSCEKYMQWRK